MKLIVGLGNPGEQYARTRHNVGFRLVDDLAKKLNLEWHLNKKFNALVADGQDMLLAKPQTFMNNSGQSVRAIIDYYKLLPKSLGIIAKGDQDLNDVLTIIHDDLDIAIGKYKISTDSRSAGHNGVQSIIDRLKTKKIRRVRIGIKPGADNRIPIEKYVLEAFTAQEKDTIANLIQEIISLGLVEN